jgi:TatD DNase family protein
VGSAGTPDTDVHGRGSLSSNRETRRGARLIDSHAHLLHLPKPLTPEGALEAARAAGVESVINIGNDAGDNGLGIELAERIPGLRTTVGWHPHHADEPVTAERLRELRKQASQPAVLAVGEIGLDYHFTDYHRVPAKEQARVFRQMLALSHEVGKPVVLHTRDAFPDMLAILDEFPGTPGVFHCFSGNAAIAAEALARGFYLSFAATVTYPNAHGVQGAVSVVPLGRILVETDAPFLPPQSRRGKPNAPEYLGETVTRIAGLRGISFDEIATVTRKNTVELFALGRR